MDRQSRTQFRRIRSERPVDAPRIADNEIRVTNNGFISQYIQYGLERLDPQNEKHFDEIVLRGMGRAISKTVQIAETIKRRVKGLHQIVDLSSEKILEHYEPTVAGMEPKGFERTISVITIRLSTMPLDKTHAGYQAPLPDNEVTTAVSRAAANALDFQPPAKQVNREERPEFDRQARDSGFGRGRRGRGRGRGRARGRGGFGSRFGGGRSQRTEGRFGDPTDWNSGYERPPGRGRGGPRRGRGSRARASDY